MPPVTLKISPQQQRRCCYFRSITHSISGTPLIPRPLPSLYHRKTKAEMLSLQPASPSTVDAIAVARPDTAAATAATADPRGESLGSSASSFPTGEPSTKPAWLIRLGVPPMPRTESSAGDRTKTLLMASQAQQGTACGWPIFGECPFAPPYCPVCPLELTLIFKLSSNVFVQSTL